VNPKHESESPVTRIIVGVDEDGRSDNALRAAAALASQLSASLDLVHAVPVPHPRWRKADPVRDAAVNAELLTRAWHAVSEHVKTELPLTDASGKPLDSLLRVLPGRAPKLLLDQVDRTQSDLIMLGPHEKRGVIDFGSTARSILAKSDRPVWVQVDEPRPIERVLVPIDLSEGCQATLRWARSFAQAVGASVTALHCFVGPAFAYAAHPETPDVAPSYVVDDLRRADEESFARTVESFDWNGVPHDSVFVEDDPAERILRMQDDYDLIVLGTHGSTALASAILGSTAYAVLKEARRPVVAIRHDRDDWLL